MADANDPWTLFRPVGDHTQGSLHRGDDWPVGQATVSVRWPAASFDLPDANMVSTVLRVRWQDRELWLMGDALRIQERDLMELGEPGGAMNEGDRPVASLPLRPPRAPHVISRQSPATMSVALHRFLKVGHHGSRSASDPEWIKLLSPDAAIITAGRRNRFGHPHDETMDILHQAMVSTFITGMERGVRMEAVRGGWEIESGSGRRAFIPFLARPRPATPQ